MNDPAETKEYFEPNLYLYDAYPGGIGFSEPLYRVHELLLQRTRELIASCPCDSGCPSCVGPAGMKSGAHQGSRPRDSGAPVLLSASVEGNGFAGGSVGLQPHEKDRERKRASALAQGAGQRPGKVHRRFFVFDFREC